MVVLGLFLFFLFAWRGCADSSGNNPGREYMPDMGHGIAYEANNYDYYYYNTWDSEEEYRAFVEPRKPVAGTVPRGFAGVHLAKSFADQQKTRAALDGSISSNAIKVPVNGSVPYYYENTDADRERATAEITENPIPATESSLKSGKELYTVNCEICHGKKIDGNGWIYENGAYPAAPANLSSDEFVNASEGRYYHSIMHGKGVMGSYADKLSYQERWEVIHYIRSIQAKGAGLPFDVLADDNLSQNFNSALAAAKSDKGATPEATTIRMKNVFFETGSAGLKRASRFQLNELAAILNANPSVNIEISGHTDNVGDPAGNMALSNARAKAVLDFLTEKGVNTSTLVGKGYGDTRPVATNETDAGKQQNRRTEVRIVNH